MFVTRLRLKNWRNFREFDMPLTDRVYVLGPNAVGKSNLLDVFRFMRDVAKGTGGGLNQAIRDRGGLKTLRCLHARRDPEVLIDVELAEDSGTAPTKWRYVLGFKSEGKGAQRVLVSQESVWRDGERLLNRPIAADRKDMALLTQTHLEQIQANQSFRDIASFFEDLTYLHLVPQLLKYGSRIGGERLEGDPFGQGFLERIASVTPRTRDARLRNIGKTLEQAIPKFRELRFERDKITGKPHLTALYEHHRPNAGWQREEHFSDGTLRLIGLLWSLLDGSGLLLLEEPELSLNDGVVEEIPALINGIAQKAKHKRQVIISTHSHTLLRNKGIDPAGVIVIEPSSEGSEARGLTESEQVAIEAGMSIAETVLPKTRPAHAHQLGLF